MTTTATSPLRQRMQQDLQLAGPSERTQEAHLRAVRKLAAHFQLPPDQPSESQVRDYFQYIKHDRKFSPRALKIAHSGIKLFYTHTVVRDWAISLDCFAPGAPTLPSTVTLKNVPVVRFIRLLERRI